MTKIMTFVPLPKSITIQPSKLHGLGLFATEDIAKGVKLGLSHVEYDNTKDDLIRTPLGAFVNHSNTPNADLLDDRKEWVLITRKEIKKGDEITVDYTPWYDPEVLKTYK